MKRTLLSLVLCCALLIGCAGVSAAAISTAELQTEGDFAFQVINGEAMVVSYKGTATTLSVPGTLGGYPVTVIGEWAFQRNEHLQEVTLPASVTHIQYQAFFSCTNLARITISDGVKDIAEQAFFGTAFYENLDNRTEGELYLGSWLIRGRDTEETSYRIKEGTRGIAGVALSHNKALTEIQIPDSVQYLGHGAFSGCDNLSAITVPNSVTYIGEWAFGGCDKLADVTLPAGLKALYKNTFWNCPTLTSITIPRSVIYMAEVIFARCDNLKDIYFEGYVPNISHEAFADGVHTMHYNPKLWPAEALQNYKGTLTWVPYEAAVTGDVDGDGKITSTDARLILQYYAGKIEEQNSDVSVSDVDGDGKITSTDARLVLQQYAGKI